MRRLAARWGLAWQEVETDELDNPDYARNDGDRCYWCKDALMAAAGPVATARGATVVLGVNLDDLGDHRPGQRAAAERGAAFPLVDAGFTKADVRAWSKELGLETWDKPAAACLASRLPVRHAGHPRSARVGRAGRGRAAGPRVRRAAGAPPRRGRSHRGAGRRPRRVLGRREAVVAAVEAAGYRWVTLDLAGLPQRRLQPAALARPPRLHVGKAMWGTSRCSTIRPLAASSSRHGAARSMPPAMGM